jgi:hypothetical protein
VKTREERIARNEAIARDINESIESSHNERSQEGSIRLMCECGQEECERLIAISVDEYEQIRQDPRHFATYKDHVTPDVEFIVKEVERYVVVQKREGKGAQIVEAENPRA